MTYAQGRVYYDADSHIMELPDFLTKFADPGMRDRVPKISYRRAAAPMADWMERSSARPTCRRRRPS